MQKSRILRKEFFITLFFKQNNHHKYGVLLHTFSLAYHAYKDKRYDMIPAAFLHDIGKPIIAYQDDEDKISKEYSFNNHEEISYQIIKNWKISNYTKNLVRYHYLIRGMKKAQKRNQISKYNRMKRKYDSLDSQFIKELKTFMRFDDLAKKQIPIISNIKL